MAFKHFPIHGKFAITHDLLYIIGIKQILIEELNQELLCTNVSD